MSDWETLLNADATDWLLGSGNPSVRYLALTDLLGKPADNPDVIRAKDAIMQTGPVPEILNREEPCK